MYAADIVYTHTNIELLPKGKNTKEELRQMEILYCSLHNLDLGKDDPVRKEIPSDFNSYISEYVSFATTENKTSRIYLLMWDKEVKEV